MRKVLCKVFAFLLSLASQIIDVIANTLIYLGTAAVEVLSEVGQALGGAFLSSPIGMIALGVGAFFLIGMFTDKDDKSRSNRDKVLNNPLVEV